MVFDFDFCGIKLEVEASVYGGYKAVTNDIPENCFTGEPPEVEIESVSVKSTHDKLEIDDITIAGETLQAAIENAAMEVYNE